MVLLFRLISVFIIICRIQCFLLYLVFQQRGHSSPFQHSRATNQTTWSFDKARIIYEYKDVIIPSIGRYTYEICSRCSFSTFLIQPWRSKIHHMLLLAVLPKTQGAGVRLVDGVNNFTSFHRTSTYHLSYF